MRTEEVLQPAFPGWKDTDEQGNSRLRIARLAERRLITQTEYLPVDGFQALFKEKAGDRWLEVEKLFNEYGPTLSIWFCTALMYAYEDGKLDWCILLLQKHLEDDLSFQHPDIRGRIVFGDNLQNRSEAFLQHEIIGVLRPQIYQQAKG